MFKKTMLLNSNYEYLRLADWDDAIHMIITNRAEVLYEYADTVIRSFSESFNLPSILRLVRTKHRPKNIVRLRNMNVFWRDDFKCQYCGDKMASHKLTIDHVIPKSYFKKGEIYNTWDNMTTACKICNNVKKKNRTPEEAGMVLLTKPFKPKWTPDFVDKVKKEDVPDEWYMFCKDALEMV